MSEQGIGQRRRPSAHECLRVRRIGDIKLCRIVVAGREMGDDDDDQARALL
jgi:hypothetical protein